MSSEDRRSSSLPKGMEDRPRSHRQPRLSSTSQARPASMQLPNVQKASSQMSHTPLPLVGMNSMNRVKDTGTPPRPNPTQNRKNISHCKSYRFGQQRSTALKQNNVQMALNIDHMFGRPAFKEYVETQA